MGIKMVAVLFVIFAFYSGNIMAFSKYDKTSTSDRRPSVNCPPENDKAKIYKCVDECCNFAELTELYVNLLIFIIVILLIICFIICCVCCPGCPFYKRKQHGSVLAQPPSIIPGNHVIVDAQARIHNNQIYPTASPVFNTPFIPNENPPQYRI